MKNKFLSVENKIRVFRFVFSNFLFMFKNVSVDNYETLFSRICEQLWRPKEQTSNNGNTLT